MAAKEAKKDLTVSVVNEEGKENYSWSFTGVDLVNSNQDITEVNLSLEVKSLEQEELGNLRLRKKDVKGMVINFNHDGILPAQATVRIYVGNQVSIEAGDRVYLYHYNRTTGKLETLPYSSRYEVDKYGYITVQILHCSDYVVLSDKAASSIITSLKNQISISPTSKNLYVGGTTDTITNIHISMPPTLQIVDNLEDETTSSAVGAVTVTYRSSNDRVATVDSNGKITAKGKGIAYITTTVKLYNGKTKTVKTTIIVKDMR